MSRSRLRAVLAGFVVLATTLTGCGLDTNTALPFTVQPGSIRPVPELEGVRITVGSKDFTENILLGYIAELALSAAGADVRDLTDIKGSSNSRQALINGDIDLTWEYTGTGWINYLGHTQPIPGERAQFEATKAADAQRFGIAWLDYSPVNNTYAFGTTRAYAEQHHLRTVTDLTAFLTRNPAQAVFCVETEFASRQDGFPGVQRTYGFPATTVKTFGTGAIYTAIANGTCNIGEIFTTDGRIAGLNLAVLSDDKKFFPQYNAAVTLRQEFLDRHPQIRQVLEPVAKAIDNQQMIELGKQVDVEGRDPGVVARDWMVSRGFIGAGTS
ncbi:glycine betaine ABC transporter substrate-binding protein [Pseudonocardia acidicola]|uniref:Glycine betaine ABC transporter substrate-binding protein n=1 Tax=Pseudonocardia acidicola TaxID=2724939 RepID=A0ABX1S7T3_9PSEU|nr:glycine betaine ABC transporter substrate-binding protein [Pseudonocardia acidicola]NMH96436.1 glycine betaine ABC transporter substrate-binding protein [Pseudonocardia acidicola]